MSEPENFIKRWSHRKQAAADAETTPEAEASARADGVQSTGPSEDLASASAKSYVEAAEPPFDPQSLPPIESITAETDIRAFLAPGVPPELARAALRRAWAADPRIRDFVGLADYAWDYHAPGSMPGFGPLEMTEELRQAVARIIGLNDPAEPSRPREAAIQPAAYNITNESNASEAVPQPHDMSLPSIEQESIRKEVSTIHICDELTPCDIATTAAQHGPNQPAILEYSTRRGHGGALPK
jgi:hypothetical protein